MVVMLTNTEPVDEMQLELLCWFMHIRFVAYSTATGMTLFSSFIVNIFT